jgi:signal transduction histidine kinase
LSTAWFTLALIGAGVVALVGISRSLLNTLDTSAERTASEVAALAIHGTLPEQLLAGSGGVSLVQVVDANNRVVAASPGADSVVSILTADELTRARRGKPLSVSGSRASLDSPLRVVAVRADTAGGQQTVLVGTDLGRVQDSSRLLRRIVLIGTPVAVLAVAAVTWWLVGRTLRPVAALQRGAADLSASGLSRSRLPVPSAEDEIHSLAVTLNDMLDRLDRANIKQQRFIGDAAHELRSPIASLRVQLEVTERLGETAEVRELAADALIDVDRLARLIDDLLTLARSDERGSLSGRVPIRLDEMCGEVTANYGEARVPVTCGPSDPVAVVGDHEGLKRVMVNLVDNAVRYARGEVRVTVHPDTAPGYAVIEVADDGPGIPAEKRERVFDRFYRLDTARSRAEGGTGLGLSIVREVVTAHRGTVTLDDNEPGLRVRVRLPVVR